MEKILIKNGRLVDPANNIDEKRDILIEDGKIKEVFSELWKKLSDGGVDITPLRNLIHEMVDEEKIRQ